MFTFLHSARAELAQLHPAAPAVALALLTWFVIYGWRKLHPASFDKLPKGAQSLPALMFSAVVAAASSGGDGWQAALDALFGALSGFAAIGGHEAAKAAPGPYTGGVAALLLGFVGFTVSSCGLLSSPTLHTANDIARDLCALHYSEQQGISLDDAAKTFCKDIRPWLDLVLRAQREGVSAPTHPPGLTCEPPEDAGVEGE